MNIFKLVTEDTKELIGYRFCINGDTAYDVSLEFLNNCSGSAELVARLKEIDSVITLSLKGDLYGSTIEHLSGNYIDCADEDEQVLTGIFSRLGVALFSAKDNVKLDRDTNRLIFNLVSYRYSSHVVTVLRSTSVLNDVKPQIAGGKISVTDVKFRGKLTLVDISETKSLNFDNDWFPNVKYTLVASLKDSSYKVVKFYNVSDSSVLDVVNIDNKVKVVNKNTLQEVKTILSVPSIDYSLVNIFIAGGFKYYLIKRKVDAYMFGDFYEPVDLSLVAVNMSDRTSNVVFMDKRVPDEVFREVCTSISNGRFEFDGYEGVNVDKVIHLSELVK